MSIKDKVAIIGVGCTKFGELFSMSYGDMALEASYEAFQDAGIEPKDIQAAWLGTAFPIGGMDGDAGTSLADPLGLFHIPMTRVSNFCATGMDAFRNACFAVASGQYDIVLAVGVEKMRDVGPRESLVAQRVDTGHPFLTKGRTAPGAFALSATRYMHVYKIDKRPLAEVAVKNHRNGAKNPLAHFRREVTVEQVLSSPMVANPLGLLDCCPTTDGAASAVIVRADIAKSFRPDFVKLKGMGLSIASGLNIFYDSRYDFLGFKATQGAAKQAYEEAGIKDPSLEINFAEVHDCFTITEILNYEDLSFCPRGEGWKFITEGHSTLEGKLPVNPSGGLKSFGHPIGATGVRMIYELTKQLQGKGGDRQVKDSRIGLAHNLGGPGVVSSVVILGI